MPSLHLAPAWIPVFELLNVLFNSTSRERLKTAFRIVQDLQQMQGTEWLQFQAQPAMPTHRTCIRISAFRIPSGASVLSVVLAEQKFRA